MNIPQKILKILVVFLAGILISTAAYSQTGTLMRLKKAKLRMAAQPGESGIDTIDVENPSPETISIRAYLEDWVYCPECGHEAAKPEFIEEATSDCCKEYYDERYDD